MPGHTKAAPVTQNHLSKPEDLRLQNATPLKKSAPGPPNISDEHVSCTAPATENASLQIFFKCPTPAIVFGNATNPHVLLTFDKVHNPLRLPRETTSERPKVVRTPGVFNILTSKGASRHNGVHFFDIATSKSGPTLVLYILTSKCASRHNGVHFFDISTSKSGPRMVCFVHFDLEMCFAPQRRALFRHRNFQKWSGNGVFCTFWLGNMLRATTACTFSTSQLPKVVRTCCVLYILTWKCASGISAFDIATSKSGANLECFVHFDLEMCFGSHPRALFRHRNCQKCTENGVFCTFWLGNVLRATTACNFSSLIWPDGSAPAALASLLFDLPEPQIIGKTEVFATFLPFRAPASSFFWHFLFSDLLSSALLSSTLLFSLTLPISAFHLSILSEVWLLNFLRWVPEIQCLSMVSN